MSTSLFDVLMLLVFLKKCYDEVYLEDIKNIDEIIFSDKI
jgi:hypothetical protein